MAVTESPSLILARALEKRKPVHGLILREMAMIKEAAGKNDMSKRILVVDDQPDNRQIIRDMLAPTDYEITEAENGELALAAIAKQRPDLILMDIQLPIMDGYTPRAGLNPIRSCNRSQSSRLPPMRLAARKRRRGPRAAMTACQNPSAHANCCRKFVITCNKSRRAAPGPSRIGYHLLREQKMLSF